MGKSSQRRRQQYQRIPAGGGSRSPARENPRRERASQSLLSVGASFACSPPVLLIASLYEPV